MPFSLKQLAYFVAAGEAGSILRAVENIHLSQPSISNAISHLEDVFQARLFIRHHARGTSLTTTGSELKYVPLSGFNPGLMPGIATLATIKKTIVVDSFSQFCREQISTEKIPGMAKLFGLRGGMS